LETLQHVKELNNVLHAQSFPAMKSQRLGCANGVLDLTAIEIVSCERIVIFFGEIRYRNFLQSLHSFNEYLKNRLLGLGVEFVVAKTNVNSGLECLVKRLNGWSAFD
jgi:hypothetical protein